MLPSTRKNGARAIASSGRSVLHPLRPRSVPTCSALGATDTHSSRDSDVVLEVAELPEPFARPLPGGGDQHHGLRAALYGAVVVRLARAHQVRSLRVDVGAQDLFELLQDPGEVGAGQQDLCALAGPDTYLGRYDVDQVGVRVRFRHGREHCGVGDALHTALSRHVEDVAPVCARLLRLVRVPPNLGRLAHTVVRGSASHRRSTGRLLCSERSEYPISLHSLSVVTLPIRYRRHSNRRCQSGSSIVVVPPSSRG